MKFSGSSGGFGGVFLLVCYCLLLLLLLLLCLVTSDTPVKPKAFLGRLPVMASVKALGKASTKAC